MSVIRVENISKEYLVGEVKVPALKGVSLAIESGEFLTLSGPSGSGKTTLLNMIGLLDTVSAGKIFIQDKEVAGLNKDQLAETRREYLGFIFQTFNLIPVLTAFENVEFPLVLNGDMDKSARAAAVEKMLTDVGLKEYMHHRPNQLSGGQQQRVAIARALVKEPKLVLADEPTANLDSKNSEEVLDIMKMLNQKNGATFVFSTHDPRVVNRATRVVTLVDGAIDSEERR